MAWRNVHVQVYACTCAHLCMYVRRPLCSCVYCTCLSVCECMCAYVLAYACLCVFIHGYLCRYVYACLFSGSGSLILTSETLASDYIRSTQDQYTVQSRRGREGEEIE